MNTLYIKAHTSASTPVCYHAHTHTHTHTRKVHGLSWGILWELIVVSPTPENTDLTSAHPPSKQPQPGVPL